MCVGVSAHHLAGGGGEGQVPAGLELAAGYEMRIEEQSEVTSGRDENGRRREGKD